ncbi:hypoxanthine phosphoribosyltransferase [Raoultella ornithinolytica]|nr:hypoxanthine phosphoribosyltransferase [Raoultella ornithinolytica]
MIYLKNQMVSLMKHTVEVMIPEAEIKARIAELGRQINECYKDSGSEMVLVGLLRAHLCLWPICVVKCRCRMKSIL